MREIRRVPGWWQHPRTGVGEWVPLHDQSYDEAYVAYYYGSWLWQKRIHPAQLAQPETTLSDTYEGWMGEPPDPNYFRGILWDAEEATCWMLYESISAGTPVSPLFESCEELLAWMLLNGYTREDVAYIQLWGSLPSLTAYTPHIGGPC